MPSTAVVRYKYFSSTTLKELSSNVDARCILDFTKRPAFTEPSKSPSNQPNVSFLTQFFVFTIWFTLYLLLISFVFN